MKETNRTKSVEGRKKVDDGKGKSRGRAATALRTNISDGAVFMHCVCIPFCVATFFLYIQFLNNVKVKVDAGAVRPADECLYRLFRADVRTA